MSRKLVDYRYELLQELGGGGMGVVYKAYDWVNREVVALKKVRLHTQAYQTDDIANFNQTIRIALAHEFKLLAGMRHPCVISVLDYGFIENEEDEENTPYFTMEYLNEAQTILDYAKTLRDAHGKLHLLVQTLEALRYIHWRDILHRDLKPDNIMLSGDSIKVLDFGIAILKQYDKDSAPAGTLLYMSPEALISDPDNPLSNASDLWSIGIIAYEMFADYHPFNPGADFQPFKIVTEIMNGEPNWEEFDDDNLTNVIRKLLEKDLSQRYQSADKVIPELAAIGNIEIKPHNESYLESVPFTGRDEEFAVLRSDLEAAKTNKGAVRFVLGESGVGKTRLIDEVRIQALIDKMMVLRGQAQREDSGPYAIWRNIVRRLCLVGVLSDLQASILKPIVPDIAKLLERNDAEIDEAPDLPATVDMSGADAAQRRLFDTIVELIRSCPRPLLILLEDLHWADSTSIALLQRVIHSVSGQALSVIGTFRSDEPSELQAQFPTVPLIQLKPLEEIQIEKIAQKILNTTEIDAGLMSLLKEESKGNAFFLVEVIRALAEESKGLDKIGQEKLPKKIFAGGIQNVIERRLSRLNEEDKKLLGFAAVVGHEIELEILYKLQPKAEIERWLAACASNAVLEVDEGRWRFSHNRLREGLLQSLGLAQDLHRRIAEYKEELYNDNASQQAAIAMHWEAAGELERAGTYYFRAAQNAETLYASSAALDYYQKALDYLAASDDAKNTELIIRERMGKLLLWQTNHMGAWQVLQPARELAERQANYLALARILISLSDIRQEEGNNEEALRLINEAEEVARQADTAGRNLALEALNNKVVTYIRLDNLETARQVAEQALKLAQDWELKRETALLLAKLGELDAYANNIQDAMTKTQDARSIARELNDERLISVMLNNLGEIHRLAGQDEEAIDYYNQALAIHNKLSALDGRLVALTNLAGCYVALEDFEQAEGNIRLVLDTLDGREWWGLGQAYEHLLEALIEEAKNDDARDIGEKWLQRAKRQNARHELERIKQLMRRIEGHTDEPADS
jgi:tetratricopeptide (TPR) repeat protein/tRNA A-37 threonylcarbamoyl transferase component Bud32